jgi:c-di-GMP-binding flagellar brake protein YcgR
VSVRIDDFSPAIHVESINLSGSGALLQRPPLGSVALPLGTALTLSIAISEDQQPVEARGTVLRELDDGSRGVHFDSIDDDHRDRLVHFLFERQRLMRQAGRP